MSNDGVDDEDRTDTLRSVIETYSAEWVDHHEKIWADHPEIPEVVRRLHDLAGMGPVLELGIGTGRIAIPLAGLGLDVYGIDAAEPMLDRLRQKGGHAIRTVVGDFAHRCFDETFSLVYCTHNTLFHLLTQREQQLCFKTVALSLAVDGKFVIEASTEWQPGTGLAVNHFTDDGVMLQATTFDRSRQLVDIRFIFIGSTGVRIWPGRARYALPPELDLMAESAGLRLADRWANWTGGQYDSQSRRHVSVYTT